MTITGDEVFTKRSQRRLSLVAPPPVALSNSSPPNNRPNNRLPVLPSSELRSSLLAKTGSRYHP